MGLIGGILGGLFGGGRNVLRETAEVFTPNATQRMERAFDAFSAVQQASAAEFATVGTGWFDHFINGLNRLPRPALALGTLGLFAFAMVDPARFAVRMQGLALVPEPLWWLLGAIVSFYFGAREMHYFRRPGGLRGAPPPVPRRTDLAQDGNRALDDWRRARR